MKTLREMMDLVESAQAGVAEASKYKCSCHAGDPDPDCPVHGLEPMEVGDALDVKKGVAESYPKHQDLSGISTDKLKAYLAKQGQQQTSGEGNQVKRVRAELQRRQQGVAEEQVEESTPDALAKIDDLFRK